MVTILLYKNTYRYDDTCNRIGVHLQIFTTTILFLVYMPGSACVVSWICTSFCNRSDQGEPVQRRRSERHQFKNSGRFIELTDIGSGIINVGRSYIFRLFICLRAGCMIGLEFTKSLDPIPNNCDSISHAFSANSIRDVFAASSPSPG